MSRAAIFALLFLGSAGCESAEASALRRLPIERDLPRPAASASAARRCPAEMVDVEGRFCIHRFEASRRDDLPTLRHDARADRIEEALVLETARPARLHRGR